MTSMDEIHEQIAEYVQAIFDDENAGKYQYRTSTLIADGTDLSAAQVGLYLGKKEPRCVGGYIVTKVEDGAPRTWKFEKA